jgi:hypothetical protein
MQIEILALRHQLAVLQRQKKRVSLGAADPLVLGTAFTHWEAMALSAGSCQTENSNCVAPKRISSLLAVEESGREVRET